MTLSVDTALADRITCHACGGPVSPGERYCESCGAELPSGAQAADAPAVAAGAPSPGPVVTVTPDLATTPNGCRACSGAVADDGYCEVCGTPAVRPRDHWVEQPVSWLAAVCDRGVQHHRNEDAVALAGTAAGAAGSGRFAALVVCDGVSTSADSDVASLSAARAARDVLAAAGPAAGPAAASAAVSAERDKRTRVLAERLRRATEAADGQARASAGSPPSPNPPACTFAAAVVQDDLLVAGWVGDSRVYWLADAGPAVQLSVDDSWATEQVSAGMRREDAEQAPQAHEITRWLGADSPDPVARTGSASLTGPGWVLVCSDGLWNYCSPAEGLRDLIGEAVAAAGSDPAAVAGELVTWANRQGGHDNVTVALARIA